MKLYYSIGPNPRVVRMFMCERGVEMEIVDVDIVAGDNLGDDYRRLNLMAQLPCLQLDDGQVISQITPICYYLDAVTPGQSLLGDTPEQIAETQMWNRRLDFMVLEPMSLGFRSAEGLPMFEKRCHVIPHAADDLKATVQENFVVLDKHLADNTYICGDRFTLADIQLFSFVEFGNVIGQAVPAECANLRAWAERIGQRPSAAASVHPSQRG